ncbi:hypothetical protein MTBLM5_450018 [Magnetospirillum sp. LM-5]|uniref:hypothetical protein n=1 Tax=Magnetospirillum sp. LM-5 TaxID=2681466 RepID=UPI00137D5063|nr:hypothetical protein [Magnetospirillum sp. LM-5]CAA7622220.1 hypothetical protein MTBLM5_450018 [Magnetospirillum sp. LM-5]
MTEETESPMVSPETSTPLDQPVRPGQLFPILAVPLRTCVPTPHIPAGTVARPLTEEERWSSVTTF